MSEGDEEEDDDELNGRTCWVFLLEGAQFREQLVCLHFLRYLGRQQAGLGFYKQGFWYISDFLFVLLEATNCEVIGQKFDAAAEIRNGLIFPFPIGPKKQILPENSP